MYDRQRQICVEPDDLHVMVQALLNWTTSGRPMNRHHFMSEVDSVITTTAQTYRDAGTADTLVAARSLLLLNCPEEALARVESVLIERGTFLRKQS
jgi:hypothetical protein